jgi:tetratricopeptide (TPR) repeat protein
MAFMAKQRAQAHYNAGTQILNNPSSQKALWEAIEHLLEATELDPSFADAFHNLAHAWYKLAEHKHLVASTHRQFKHMQDVENAIKDALDKGRNDIVEKIREQYVKESGGDGLITGYFVFALQAVDRALEIRYDFPQAHNTRAMILAKLGRLDEAIQATEVALSQDPDYKSASENREKMKELRKTQSTT